MSIWNKKEEQPAPRPAAAPPAPPAPPAPKPMPEIRKETTPVSSIPHRVTESSNTATIGKAVKIVGQIYTKEDLNVDGDVEGTIESQDNKVTIGSTGRSA